jgi:hypothetical protein
VLGDIPVTLHYRYVPITPLPIPEMTPPATRMYLTMVLDGSRVNVLRDAEDAN